MWKYAQVASQPVFCVHSIPHDDTAFFWGAKTIALITAHTREERGGGGKIVSSMMPRLTVLDSVEGLPARNLPTGRRDGLAGVLGMAIRCLVAAGAVVLALFRI